MVEELTDEIERRAWEYIEKIDSLGGMVKAIEVGFPQSEIEDAAFQYQRGIDAKQIEIVGVNVCQSTSSAGDERIELLKVDPQLERTQVEKLQSLRLRRDNVKVNTALLKLKSDAEAGVNIMPAICEAVEHLATLGEISNILRDCFGRHAP